MRRRARRLLVPVAMMSLALVAAGCDDGSAPDGPAAASPATRAGDATPSQAPSQPSAPASSPAAATASPSRSATATPTPDTGADAAGPGRCTAENLGMTVRPADGGAGQVYYRLTFVNKSARSCTLNGFPGVSLIQRDGAVIGVPAGRDGAAKGPTVLAPGKTAHVFLHTLNRGIADGGCWKRADYLRVYPPGSKEALTLRDPQVRICGDRFTTTSVEG
ncbi:DUF4232 domain-containing protein [Streptomyces sp. OfavH-34-F]|uniref:DUF4232 domain-containing protein n=1 Tax=Streptomyces sp. OfavH-34-F TaxID=2917760 RepID=UPI001EF2F251|nr:DUF4232 domain-containing protein [Streptomyces sp. OfavH-34-F]MCG7524681.1 DUF4232 domain-containing protein [Streptomyces sp. OfavH-34-F]